MKMYVVESHSHRFWIEGYGWATSKAILATAYTHESAIKLAQLLHGFVTEL